MASKEQIADVVELLAEFGEKVDRGDFSDEQELGIAMVRLAEKIIEKIEKVPS